MRGMVTMLVALHAGCSSLVGFDELSFAPQDGAHDAASFSDASAPLAEASVLEEAATPEAAAPALWTHQRTRAASPATAWRPSCAGASFHAVTRITFLRRLSSTTGTDCGFGGSYETHEAWYTTSWDFDESTCAFQRVRLYNPAPGQTQFFEDEGVYVSATRSEGTMRFRHLVSTPTSTFTTCEGVWEVQWEDL